MRDSEFIGERPERKVAETEPEHCPTLHPVVQEHLAGISGEYARIDSSAPFSANGRAVGLGECPVELI